jgi:hypothetical protein
MSDWTKRASRLMALAAACVIPSLTWAQGCALCYTQAAGSGSRVIQALKSGILILVIPPMLICLGITWMAYKKNNEFNEELPADVSESGSKG